MQNQWEKLVFMTLRYKFINIQEVKMTAGPTAAMFSDSVMKEKVNHMFSCKAARLREQDLRVNSCSSRLFKEKRDGSHSHRAAA